MKRRTAGWPALVVVAVLGISTVWAQTAPTGTVKGSVKSAGSAVAGVRVVIDSMTKSSYSASAVTDSEGGFAFSDAPVGEVEVKAYDSEERVLARSRGVLSYAGEVITLAIEVGQ